MYLSIICYVFLWQSRQTGKGKIRLVQEAMGRTRKMIAQFDNKVKQYLFWKSKERLIQNWHVWPIFCCIQFSATKYSILWAKLLPRWVASLNTLLYLYLWENSFFFFLFFSFSWNKNIPISKRYNGTTWIFEQIFW